MAPTRCRAPSLRFSRFGIGLTVLLGACNSEVSILDGGVGGGGAAAACPSYAPQTGTSCVSRGLTCSYSDDFCCPPSEYECTTAGTWEGGASQCGVPPTMACPDELPISGTNCMPANPCEAPVDTCVYGDCYGAPEHTAVCNGGTWEVATTYCPGVCDGLDVCGCLDEPGCLIVSEDCFCACDYECPGHEPCDCGCGGGAFLGCEMAF